MLRRRAFAVSTGLGCALLAAVLLALMGQVNPALSEETASPSLQETQPPEQKSISDDVCLSCHGQPGLTMELQNGQNLILFVPAQGYYDSVHGELGYACVQCHTRVGNYPHPPFNPEDVRAASLDLYGACERCHLEQYTLTQDSVHADALAAGNRNAAICTDCHPPHTVQRLTDSDTGELLPESHERIPEICAQCHNAIYQKYLTSVHGSALVGEGNPDVPTCIDCHGVHNIENPTTAEFRLNSPKICADCHTDPQIMDKYGISTQVLSTYIADFHGTTVTLFRKEHPDQQTNKPVCYDCHGVHDIQRVDDPETGLQIRENLLARCRVCHPDATANFPDAWLSHYEPTPEKNALVYFVNQFYRVFIPTLLGGMAILVALDISGLLRIGIRKRESLLRRWIQRFSSRSRKLTSDEPPSLEGIKPPGEPVEPIPTDPSTREEVEKYDEDSSDG